MPRSSNVGRLLQNAAGVSGLNGIDIGCGEGFDTRLLAARGARVAAVEVAAGFVGGAAEHLESRGIRYTVASGLWLPFAARSFDFAAAFMSLMDLGALERALPEIARVLRPGGFLQFSILHPCFSPPHRRLVRDGRGLADTRIAPNFLLLRCRLG